MRRLQDYHLTAFPVVNHAPMHLHLHGQYTELVVVTGGSGRHVLEIGSFPIQRGDVFVVPPELKHGYSDCVGLCLTNVMFSPNDLHLPEHQLKQIAGYHALFTLEPRLRVQHDFASRLRLEDARLEEILSLVKLLYREITDCSPGFQLASTSLLCAILVELARAYKSMSDPMPQNVVRLADLLGWLDTNYRRPLTVNELARRAHMSRSTLGRCFRESFGMSPMGYVIDLRIRKAEDLLRNTDTQIREIAPRVGIEDANYFARVFRKHTGVEPTAYRAQHRALQARA